MKRTPDYIIPLAISALAALHTPANANDYLKIDGIKGEEPLHATNNPNHPDEIRVLAWGWQLSQSSDLASPVVRPISINKYIDSTSPALYNLLLSGTAAKNATLSLESGPTPTACGTYDYAKFEMTNVTVSAANPSSTSADFSYTRPFETIWLNFGSVCVTYTSCDEGLAQTVSTQPTCWTFK